MAFIIETGCFAQFRKTNLVKCVEVEINQLRTKGEIMLLSERSKQFWREVKAGLRPAPKRDRSAPTKRLVECRSNWARGNKIILIIYPHGEIGFRAPHSRVEYKIGVPACYTLAVKTTVNKLEARTKELKKQGHGLAEARRIARKEIL